MMTTINSRYLPTGSERFQSLHQTMPTEDFSAASQPLGAAANKVSDTILIVTNAPERGLSHTYDKEGKVSSAGTQPETDKANDYLTRYTTQAGDTLGLVAERVLGDKQKWYLLAEANDLKIGANDALNVGESLALPAVTSVSPELAPAAAEPSYGWLSALIQVVVTVAVTVAVTALTGGLGVVAAGVIGGAMGGMLGSLAGQTSAMLANNQFDVDKYNVKQIVFAGAAGAIGGGLFGASGALDAVVSGESLLTQVVFMGSKESLVGMAANAVEQGIGMASGEQSSFSPGALAAGALTGLFSGNFSAVKNVTKLGEGGAVSMASALAVDVAVNWTSDVVTMGIHKSIDEGQCLSANEILALTLATAGRITGGALAHGMLPVAVENGQVLAQNTGLEQDIAYLNAIQHQREAA